MNKHQFEELEKVKAEDAIVCLKDIHNKKDRTLLYGYTCERETFHVYIRQGKLHKIIFNSNDYQPRIHEQGEYLRLEGIVPDKRLYPEACDFDFCSLLTKAGVNLPFTTWDNQREAKTFHSNVVQPSGNLSSWVSVK